MPHSFLIQTAGMVAHWFLLDFFVISLNLGITGYCISNVVHLWTVLLSSHNIYGDQEAMSEVLILPEERIVPEYPRTTQDGVPYRLFAVLGLRGLRDCL